MATLSSWISALRPRTLFLAAAITICPNAIAYSVEHFNLLTCILTIALALLLQLLSNLANDLGDFEHGTDITGNRLGPTRTLQSGAITTQEMKRGITFSIGIIMLIGAYLIYQTIQHVNIYYIISLLLLGAASIWAAIKYTSGKNAYGYKGLGDLFCFIFFGLVPVVGTYFLQVYKVDFQPWLPAVSMGAFSTAVLNVNNMRDMDNDLASGKHTLAIKLGANGAKIYHTILTFIGILCFILYSIIYNTHWYQYLYMIFFIPFIIILCQIYRIKNRKELDPYLKYTSMSTFFISVAFAIFTNI